MASPQDNPAKPYGPFKTSGYRPVEFEFRQRVRDAGTAVRFTVSSLAFRWPPQQGVAGPGPRPPSLQFLESDPGRSRCANQNNRFPASPAAAGLCDSRPRPRAGDRRGGAPHSPWTVCRCSAASSTSAAATRRVTGDGTAIAAGWSSGGGQLRTGGAHRLAAGRRGGHLAPPAGQARARWPSVVA